MMSLGGGKSDGVRFQRVLKMSVKIYDTSECNLIFIYLNSFAAAGK